jgi:rhodanese-related sulfurtransferase
MNHDSSNAITASALASLVRSAQPPIVIDVRRDQRWREAPDLLRGALRRDPDTVSQWKPALPAGADVVVYCVHGHEVSQNTAKALGARYLEGGIERWRAEGGDLQAKPRNASTRWVTRERPKIDRIACPWLVKRFVDPQAEFLYVPPQEVLKAAQEREAEPYDVPDVAFTHEGERCSFDAFIRHYRLRDPALDELALIVRAADTGKLGLAPQAAGLLAVSLGLSLVYQDDHELLARGMTVYDALYTWCKKGKAETHTWNPDLYK